MENKVSRPKGKGRPRKRRRPKDEGIGAKSNSRNKRFAAETGSIALVNRYVLKEFQDNGVFLGKIVFYDTGLYRVEYEDGDCEDLDSSELRELILEDADFDCNLIERKKKLDKSIERKSLKKTVEDDFDEKAEDSNNAVHEDVVSTMSDLSDAMKVENGEELVEDNASSPGVSYHQVSDKDTGSAAEALIVPPLELPLSSGTIGVPEEYVSHLFSVYGFLRSFSIQLFLFPFELDDLVGALNCSAPNTLLDAVHVALLRALRYHVEAFPSEGSEKASKCLRSLDWSLLDVLTWPVYLVQYLTIMGHIKGTEWRKLCEDVSRREYYSVPVGRKLINMQFLCDDVLESLELRAEIDMREKSDVGIDSDAAPTIKLENGPKRVHPRFLKTLACKEKEDILSKGHESKSYCKPEILGSNDTERNANAVDTVMDTNSDECRLCGMDGTLLCCDGCPSAYHSRCIGVTKMHIPDGSWYCPECTIDNIGPTIAVETSLRGAELFGIDLHGHVFFGTCNHLLVLKTSTNLDSYLRYYNLNDIPKVLKELSSSIHHGQPYLRISEAIIKYWNLPDSICSLIETIETGCIEENVVIDAKPSALSLQSPSTGSCKLPGIVDGENASNFSTSNEDNAGVSCLNSSKEMMNQNVLPGFRLSEQSNAESVFPAGSVRQHTDTYDVGDQSIIDKPTAKNGASYTLGNSVGILKDGMDLGGEASCRSKAHKNSGYGSDLKNSVIDSSTYMGLPYKPQAYVNHYNHGEVSAVAAAKLAVHSSEESQGEANKACSRRKSTSARDNSLQVKAFSSIASRFLWPNAEKKFPETVRERCGWCHSCKALTSCKRACMLSVAVSSASRSCREIINGLPFIKNRGGSGNLPSIAAYILYMEESLRGLVTGPFLNPSYWKQWGKRVEEALTLSTVKNCLLELEKNISIIALSTEWVKLMDDGMIESSIIGSTSSSLGLQKLRPGRRLKKQSGICEVASNDLKDKRITWWRGGRLSEHVFQKAILPYSIVKKAAKRGGKTRISGITYADGSRIPKRNRQLSWRAAVERSKTSSQLAVQVRFLDLHVRWNDLVCPEQNFQEGKGVETEASVFRNAIICDKKSEENRIMYGIAFGDQKHLPSRVMKNIINIEQNSEGKEKYWFRQTHIPLYLIKQYEEKVGEALLPPVKKPSRELSELQKRQLKASRKNIFVYLTTRRDKSENCSCASCGLNVLLRDAATCSTCQGYCHKDCTSSSIYINGKIEHLIICKLCCHARGLAQNDQSNKSPSTPLLRGRECHNTMAMTKSTQVKVYSQPPKPLTSVRSGDSSTITKEQSSEDNHAATGSSTKVKTRKRLCHWGVIWMKKYSDDTGIEFRRANLIQKGDSDKQLLNPECQLCKQPHNPELMYIHCETCTKWYHADAVELEESRISDLVGFKCCRCRRIRGPECPYMDSALKNQTHKKPFIKAQEQGQDLQAKDCKSTIPLISTGDDLILSDDSLDFSISKVELIRENTSEAGMVWNSASGIGLQKLPVRRQLKRERKGEEDCFNHFHADLSKSLEPSIVMKPKEVPSLAAAAQWDVSGTSLKSNLTSDRESHNCEYMESESQTYFSFNELQSTDNVDASRKLENPLNPYLKGEQHQVGSSNNQVKPMSSAGSIANELQCRLCRHKEPAPDLLCLICGFLIHRYCSPWDESESVPSNGRWSCGRCREWR